MALAQSPISSPRDCGQVGGEGLVLLPILSLCVFWGHVRGRVSVFWLEEKGPQMGQKHSGSLLPWWFGSVIPARPGAPWGIRPRGGQTVLLPSALPPPVPTPCLTQNGMCSLWNRMGWELVPRGPWSPSPPPPQHTHKAGRSLRAGSCSLAGLEVPRSNRRPCAE